MDSLEQLSNRYDSGNKSILENRLEKSFTPINKRTGPWKRFRSQKFSQQRDLELNTSTFKYSNRYFRTLQNVGPITFLSAVSVPILITRPFVGKIIRELLLNFPRYETSRLVVWGPAGVGKTQIVLEYVRRFQAFYKATYWIEAGCRESLEKGYVYLQNTLVLNHRGGVISVEEAVKSVKSYFTSQPGPWLIVFDGADIIEGEEGSQHVDLEHLVPDRANLHVIVTTRSHTTNSMARTEGVEVGGMDEAQALELFYSKSRVQRHIDKVENEAKNIVQELKMLPLTVTLAATYIRSHPYLLSEIKDFLPEYEEQKQRVLQQSSVDHVVQYTESFIVVYEMCHRAITRENPLASTILTMMSFYSFDDLLPQIFLKSGQEMERLTDIRKSSERLSKDLLDENFLILKNLSFIEWRDKQQSFSMNRLIHNWGYDRLSKAEQRRFCYETFRLIARVFYENWKGSRDLRRLVPHVMASFRKLRKDTRDFDPHDEILLKKLVEIGRIMNKSGFLREGCMIDRYVFKQRSHFLGEEHLETIKARTCLASTLKDQGYLVEAEQMFREVIYIRERVSGEKHPDTIKTLSYLATTLKVKGWLDEAENYFFIGLERCKGLLVPELSLCRGLIGNIMSVRELRIIGLEKNDNDIRNPIHHAVIQNDINLLRILIRSTANADSQSDIKIIAMQKALYLGNHEIVRLLLDAGFDVNTQYGLFGNALQTASRLAYQNVIKVLLDAGADVNAQGGQYGNALQAASSKGSLTAVETLLDAGANVNAEGGLYGSALQASSGRGSEQIVQMLLNSGADVNLQGGPFGNALQASLISGNSRTVKRLLAAGAHGYVHSGLFYELLRKESDEDKKVVQMLVEYEMDSRYSIATGTQACSPTTESVSSQLNDLFNQSSRLRYLMFTIVQYSYLNQDRLADILQRHIVGLVQNIVNEPQTKRQATYNEACKYVLYHSRLLISEIIRFYHDRVGLDSLGSRRVLAVQTQNPSENFLPYRLIPPSSHNLRTIDYVINEPASIRWPRHTFGSYKRNWMNELYKQEQVLDVSKGLFELFAPSKHLNEFISSIWENVQPDLFDWSSISLRWRNELGEPPPTILYFFHNSEIQSTNEKVLSSYDKVKFALERFTTKEWDWWPFTAPKRPIVAGKIRLEWNICCGQPQVFDVSLVLAAKVKSYIQVPDSKREISMRLYNDLMMTEGTNNLQLNNSSQLSSDTQMGFPDMASSTLKPSQEVPPQTHSRFLPPVSSTSLKQVQPSQRRDGFVLICVRNMYGPDSLKHSQIEITNDMTDNMFFQEFRKQYRSLRGRFYWLHFDQFWFCHSSRFYKWDFNKVAWENHEMPKDACYMFIPKPPPEPYSLPVSRDEWEHRYHRNCSFANDDFLYRIPKRDTRFEIDTCTNPHHIWGLQVEYRVSARVILAWLICFIFPGIIFFIVWVFRFSNDLQNASVPALFLVAFTGIILSLVNVRFK